MRGGGSDLGDLNELKTSIALHGLLHPVVVGEDGRVVAGGRRLEACRALGWTDVPVTFVSGVLDAVALLEMERDENVCRKDMTPSEKVALGMALTDLEWPRAAERQREHGGTAPGRRNTSVPPYGSVLKPDVRDIVAPAVGLSTASSCGTVAIPAANALDDAGGAARGPGRAQGQARPPRSI